MAGEDNGVSSQLLKEIRQIHDLYTLCGSHSPESGLIGLEDSILSYIIALMRGVPELPPTCTPDQWRHIVSCLQSHWVNPFLYWRTRSCPVSMRPPAPVLEALKSTYTSSMISQLNLDRQLAGITDALRSEGTEFLVLKGAALSRTVYPDRHIRPGSDVDILTRPGDVKRARKALELAGYTCKYPYFDVSSQYFYEEEFTYKDSGAGYLSLELHWDQAPLHVLKKYIDIEGYFSRSIRVKVGTREISVMDPADALVYQSVHMIAKHFNEVRLSWVNDIAFLCQYLEKTGDWEKLRSRAAESNTGPLLRPALRMAELWTGIKVPQDIYTEEQTSEKEVREALKRRMENTPGFASSIKTLWPAEASLKEKCRLVKYFALPPEHIMRTIHFPGQDLSLPAMHLKRWRNMARRNLGR